MNIVYEKENDTVFALAFGEVIDGYYHEELLIGEIDPALGGFMVRFESAWNNPIHCATIEEAMALIQRDYRKYKATSLGRNFYLG